MSTLAAVELLVLCLWLPMVFRWGVKSASIRLAAMLGGTFLVVSWWQEEASPLMRSRIIGFGVLGVLALASARGSGRGGIIRRRGRGRGVGRGRAAEPVVPRQGGGWVNGPPPFNAGGPPTVVVVAERGATAARGVGRRLGRGRRHLEVVGGTAVENIREGRVPWRARPVLAWLTVGSWFEGLARVGRHRTVDALRADVDGQAGPDFEAGWVPGWMRSDTDRLRDDLDGRPG